MKNEFFRRFKNVPFNFCFLMFFIICKMLALLKNHLNYLNDNIFECFFSNCKKLSFSKKIIFFITYNDEKSIIYNRLYIMRILSVEECLVKTRIYLKDFLNDLKKSDKFN